MVQFSSVPEMSFKALVRQKLGWSVPLQRHDYIIDRCGTKRRYIVDFYARDDISLCVDARPAFDYGIGYVERFLVPPYVNCKNLLISWFGSGK